MFSFRPSLGTVARVSTFITRLAAPAPAGAKRLAVKDCIDVAGAPTTAGSRVLADRAEPAERDAACLAGFRRAGVAIVGKANLHELCFGATGVNPHFGTPVNPLDPTRIPGGSSSGSGVAVAAGEADWALGTDTTGSVRNPAACCGVVGLRPTYGLIATEGARPLAPSLDTVGILARTVADVADAFAVAVPDHSTLIPAPPATVGRLRIQGTDVVYDAAIDRALARAELTVVEVELAGWEAATAAARTILFAEAWATNASLYREAGPRLSPDVAERLAEASTLDAGDLMLARRIRETWRAEIDEWLGQRVEALVLPSLLAVPPRLGEHTSASNLAALAPSLLAGPALTLPVPCARPVPAGLQLLGAPDAEDSLLALAARLEAAAAPA